MPSSYFALGGDILVNPGLSSDPNIAYLTGGRFVVMGQQRSGLNPATTFFQVYGANGNPIGGRVSLSGTLNNALSTPDIAAISGDRFVITYVSGVQGNGQVRAQLYDSGGSPIGAPLVVSTGSELGTARSSRWQTAAFLSPGA